MRKHTSRRSRAALALAAFATAALVGGCSVGGDGLDAQSEGGTAASDSAAGDSETAPDESGADRGAPEPAKGLTGGQADAGGGANRPSVQTRAVIRTGEVAVVAKDMARARADVDGLLGKHGGYLATEDTTNDRRGRPEHSTLVLRVPEPAFDDVMAGLTGIGRTERADRSSDDVTTEVIDVDTRVATGEASLARLQRFLREATSVDDMIRLESEIATRQASLESLKAQQRYLRDQTSLATITVHLRTPAAPAPEPKDDDSGFLAGLADGWAALTKVLVGAATVTGALLPFAVALAVIGLPTWLLVRTVLRRRVASAAPPPAADAG